MTKKKKKTNSKNKGRTAGGEKDANNNNKNSNNTNSNSSSGKKKKCWLVDSPEHKEFVALCEKKKWQNLKHLPIRGSKEAKELDRFMDTGLVGHGQPFSRDQVNRKFKLWKKSYEEEKKLRELDPTKIQSAASLMNVLKQSETWVLFLSRQQIYFYEKSPVYVDMIGADSWLIRLLEVLRKNVLDSVGALMLQEDESESSRMSAYTDDEKMHLESFIASFLSEFLEQASVKVWLEKEKAWIEEAGKDEKLKRIGHIKSAAEGVASDIGTRFICLLTMAIQRGGKGSLETMEACAKSVIDEFVNTDIDLSTDNMLTRTIFNIAGWLVKSIKSTISHRKDSILTRGLRKVLESSDATGNSQALQNLPTRKIDKASKYRQALHYPSPSFFKFVLMVEKVCEELFMPRSIKIYGSKIVDQLAQVLEEMPAVQQSLKDLCRNRGNKKLTQEELPVVTNHLIRTYMKMRSRDYVRLIMQVNRRSLNQGTRATLGVMASGVCGRRAGFTRGSKNTGNDFICFYCGAAGHTVVCCVKAKKRPMPGQPKEKEVEVVKKDEDGEEITSTFVWHWCEECIEWKEHSTDNHDFAQAQDDAKRQASYDEKDEEDEEAQEDIEEMENIINQLCND